MPITSVSPRSVAAQRVQPPRIAQIPAPTGGLNSRDSWEAMKSTDAIVLKNFFPDFGSVTVRKGSSTFATITGGTTVETLVEYNYPGGRKLLAASNGKVHDATAGGTISTALGTGFTNDRWETAQLGGEIVLVNGDDAPQHYDGTTFGAATISGSGLTVADLSGVTAFKSRCYYWTGNDASFWYSATNAIAGVLTEFDLGDLGVPGKLVNILTWTRDGGDGAEDLFVAVMDTGECVVYAGSDPGASSIWQLVGRFMLGKPVGPRAWAKIGGDVMLVTSDGYTLLSQALPGTRGASGINLSDRIVGDALTAIQNAPTTFGWDAIHYPRGRALFITYPDGSYYRQHVANLSTGAWTLYTGMEGACWVLFNDVPYFGAASGKIIQADTGTSDDGVDIDAVCRTAYQYLGKATNVQVTSIQPIMEVSSQIPVDLGVSVDFSPSIQNTITTTLGTISLDEGTWDVSEWDAAFWGTGAGTVKEWLIHQAKGRAISLSLEISQGAQDISWRGTTLAYRPIGII